MQLIISLRDDLHEMSKPIFCRKKKHFKMSEIATLHNKH